MASGNDVFSWYAKARISKSVNSNRMANLDVLDESAVSFCCTSQLSLYGGSLKHGDLSGLLLVKAGPQASHEFFSMASKSSPSGLITIAMEDTASWTPSTAAPAKNIRMTQSEQFH